MFLFAVCSDLRLLIFNMGFSFLGVGSYDCSKRLFKYRIYSSNYELAASSCLAEGDGDRLSIFLWIFGGKS